MCVLLMLLEAIQWCCVLHCEAEQLPRSVLLHSRGEVCGVLRCVERHLEYSGGKICGVLCSVVR